MSGVKMIHETSKISNSSIDNDVNCYRNTLVSDSTLRAGCSIGDDSVVERSEFENNVIINRRNYINDTTIGAFTYTGIGTIVNFAKIGRFCSISRNVDIGGADHDYRKMCMIPEFRMRQMLSCQNEITGCKMESKCEIGNDVWIETGAIIVGKVKIGDGAVIGAGAVVTNYIPPYAIAVGVPAKVVKYRFNDEIIKELLDLKWWDWSREKIIGNLDLLLKYDVDEDLINSLKK